MSLTDIGIQEQKDFLIQWPLERVQNMTLEEYSNSDRETSFVYWLEKKTEHTGSIWGGSAFKFGIYKRKNLEEFVPRKMSRTDGVYGWLVKYGETKEQAFATVKAAILEVITASVAERFEDIDSVDLGAAVKWKIAFL